MSGALRELLADLDIRITGADKLGAANKAIDATAGIVKKAVSAIAVGAIASKVKDWTSDLMDQASALKHQSRELGLSTQDLQAWQVAAKLGGVGSDEFTAGLKKLEVNAGKAAENGAATGDEFAALGVALREDAGGPMRDVQEILHDTGMAIAKLPDPMARAAAATKVFGRAVGPQMLPLFEKGEEGLNKYLQEVNRLGGGLSDNAIKSLTGMKHSMKELDVATLSIKSRLAEAFLPLVAKGASALSKFTETAVAWSKSASGAQTLQAALIALGAVAAAIAGAFLIEWAPIIAGFVLLMLAIDEVKTSLEGGDSLIKRFLDDAFGAGTGDSVFATIKKDVKALIDEVKALFEAIKNKGVTKAVEDYTTSKLKKVQKGLRSEKEDTFASRSDANEARQQIAEREGRESFYTQIRDKKAIHFGSRNAEDIGVAKVGTLGTVNDSLKQFFKDQSEIRKITGAYGDVASGGNFFDRIHALKGGEVSERGGKPTTQNNTVQSTNNITINAKGSSADDVKDGTSEALNESNKATLAALSTAVD